MSVQQGLCGFDSLLYAAWKGVIGDESLWFSSLDGTKWSAQEQIPGVASSVGPSLAVAGGKLYAAWKGSGNDQGIWYASCDGTKWSAQEQIAGVASSTGPSLAVLGDTLYAAWKGWWDDQTLWYASFDGTSWSTQKQIPGVLSNLGPSLAPFQGKLYAAWKGEKDDQRLWYASFDGTAWSAQKQIVNRASSIGPSLAEFGGKLYAAWKGASADQGIWYASFDGTNWSAQHQIPGATSSIGPSIAVFGGKLYATWKGAGSDQRLWCASFDGANWSAQKNIPGFTAQDVVSAPSSGLGSNSNYILYSYCKPLIKIAVDLHVTEDLVVQSSTGTGDGAQGFALQLNAWSPQDEKSAWQQYIINLYDKQFYAWIQNWPLSGDDFTVNHFFPLNTSAPTSLTIPAGYHLKIMLQNDPQGNVIDASFAVIGSSGVELADVTKHLLSLKDVTKDDIAPIAAFQVNLVGPVNGGNATFSSGAGSLPLTSGCLLPLWEI